MAPCIHPILCPKRTEFYKHAEKWINQNATTNSRLIVGGDINRIMERTDRSSGIMENCNNHFFNFQNNCNY